MKRTSIALAIVVAALGAVPAARQAPSAQVLIEAARKAETVDGDPKAAIAQYEQIVKRFPNDRAVVADALVRMAGAYRKLGDAQAKAIYERVVREYGDQAGAVSAARAALGAGRASAEADNSTVSMRRVWAGAGVDTSGSVSPDGRYIAFVDEDTGDVAVRDLETGTKRRLTATPAGKEWEQFAESAVFSPDGRQIAFGWFTPNNLYEVRLVDAKASPAPAPRTVFASEDVTWAIVTDWSRDGRWLAALYTRQRSPIKLVQLSTTDGSLRELRELREGAPTNALFSPDGRFIAFDMLRKDGGDDRDIVVRRVDGGGDVFVAPAPGHEALMGWSPDGKRLVFTSDRSGVASLWAIDVNDGRPAGPPRMINAKLGDTSLGLTPGGSLFVGVEASSIDIHIATIDRSTGRRLSEPRRPMRRSGSRQPAWSLDGTQLAFTNPGRHPGLGRSLGVLDARTGETRDVQTGLRAVRFPRWSPDGQEVVAEGKDSSGRSGIFRIAVATGEATPVAMVTDAQPGFLTRPSWSPDGRRNYYTHHAPNGDTVVVAHDSSTGTAREVPGSRQLLEAQISPDGRHLLGTSRSKFAATSEVRLVDVASGESRVLYSVKRPEALTWVVWTPDGRNVLLKHVSADAARPVDEALLVPLDGSAPTRLDLPGVTFGYMSLNPDGTRIAYQAGKEEHEVWMLENFLPAAPKAAKK